MKFNVCSKVMARHELFANYANPERALRKIAKTTIPAREKIWLNPSQTRTPSYLLLDKKSRKSHESDLFSSPSSCMFLPCEGPCQDLDVTTESFIFKFGGSVAIRAFIVTRIIILDKHALLCLSFVIFFRELSEKSRTWSFEFVRDELCESTARCVKKKSFHSILFRRYCFM